MDATEVMVSVVYLDDRMIVTTERVRNWRVWQDRWPDSFKASLEIGSAEDAVDFLALEYPSEFENGQAGWAACIAEMAKHIGSARVFGAQSMNVEKDMK